MGMNEQQYLGMYIQMEYKRQHGKWETYKVCPNGHSINEDHPFCSQCGSEIQDESTQPIELITYDDLLDDELVPAEVDDFCVINLDSSEKTWLVQNLTKGKYGVFLEDADYGAYEITANSDNIRTEFMNEFADLIAGLQKYCKNVKVGYGVIKYYN